MEQKFFKKAVKSLALCLAATMVMNFTPTNLLTVKAALKRGIVVHKKKTILNSKKGVVAFVGGKKVDLDLLINGKNITKGVKWKTNSKNVKVDKNGKVTAKKNGKAIVVARYKKRDYKALVNVKTRAESVSIVDAVTNMPLTELNLFPGDSKDLKLVYKLSDKVTKAGGVQSTYLSYLSVTDASVVEANKATDSTIEFTVKANKEGTSTVSVVANQTSREKASGKFGVSASLNVIVASRFGASQTGASKITVKGTSLGSNPTDYVVKSTLNHPVTSVVVNPSLTEAVLTMATPLKDAVYTVNYFTNSASFTGSAEKAEKIDVPNKYLVLNGAFPFATGSIEYKVFNQFNEEITKKLTRMNATVTVGTATVNPAQGKVDVAAIPAVLPLGSEVTVTLVSLDPASPINGEFKVVLSEMSKAASIDIKGIYEMDKKTPYTISVNNSSENAKARLLVEVKDQYGRRFPSTTGVNINFNTGSTGLGIDPSLVYSNTLTVDGVDYIAIPFTGTDVVKEGKASVNLIALGGGSNNFKTYDITISGAKQVSNFTVTPPPQIIAKEKTEFGFRATNSVGETVTDYATLTNVNFGVKLPPFFAFENTPSGVKLIYNANLDPTVNAIVWSDLVPSAPSNAIFTIAATSMPNFITFQVEAPARPVALKEIEMEGIVENSPSANVLTKIELVDSKGRTHKDLSLFEDYYIGYSGTLQHCTINGAGSAPGTVDNTIQLYKIKDLNTSFLQFFSNPAIPGDYWEQELKLAVYEDNTGTKEISGTNTTVKITLAEFKNLSNFEIGTVDKLYTGTTNNPADVLAAQVGNVGYNDVYVWVYGKAKNNKKVRITDSQYMLSDNPENISNDPAKTLSPSKAAYKATKNGDLTDEIMVVVNDGVGTMLKKNVILSTTKPVVTGVTQKATTLVAGNLGPATVASVKATLDVTDTYTNDEFGVWSSTALALDQLSSIRLVQSSNPLITAEWNNTKLIKINGAAVGDKITLEISFEGGVKKVFEYTIR